MLTKYTVKIANLEKEVTRLKRGKKRRVIFNPNRHFISLSEILTTGKTFSKTKD